MFGDELHDFEDLYEFCDCASKGNCLDHTLCEACETNVMGSMVLFSAMHNVVRAQRDVGAPRRAVRDRLIYNAIARMGVGENTAAIFDMLWPKPEEVS